MIGSAIDYKIRLPWQDWLMFTIIGLQRDDSTQLDAKNSVSEILLNISSRKSTRLHDTIGKPDEKEFLMKTLFGNQKCLVLILVSLLILLCGTLETSYGAKNVGEPAHRAVDLLLTQRSSISPRSC